MFPTERKAMKVHFLRPPIVFIALSAVPGFAQERRATGFVEADYRVEAGLREEVWTEQALLEARDGAVASPMYGVGSGTTAGGRPVLIGPGYRLVFDEPGIAFHPALGPAAPVTQELAYELLDVRVGGVELFSATDEAQLRLDGIRAHYEHAGGVRECYEATLAGVEQSFVFPERPLAQGDLVVRGRLRTNMLAVEAPGGGLAFELTGVGGVTIGAVFDTDSYAASAEGEPSAVLGIDAEGTTARGTIRFDGNHVEYVLPASFVAEAAYPLVLDPLIGADVQVSDSSERDDRADAAATLCVWDVGYSAIDYDVYARWESTSIHVVRATEGMTSQAPAVGLVKRANGYVIAWQEGPSPTSALDVLAATVPGPAGQFVSPSVLVAGSVRDERSPAVGGDSRDCCFYESALIVWAEEGEGIQAVQAEVSAAGPLLGTTTLLFGGDFRDPTITKSGGEPGRYLIAAEKWFATPAPGDHDLHYGVYSSNLTPVSFERAMVSIGTDEQGPSAAGDGTTFTLVWDVAQADASPLFPDRDILAAQIGLDGTILNTQVVKGEVGIDECTPSAAWAGYRTAVAWVEAPNGSVTKVGMTTLCNDTFEVCSPLNFIDGPATSPPTPNYYPVLTSDKIANHETISEGGSIYWTRGSAITGSQSIFRQNYESYEPWSFTNLGGGCGDGFNITIAGPPAIGYEDFWWLVEVPPPTTVSMIVMNAKPNAGPPFSCGPCELQLDVGMLQAIPSSSGFFSTPIPGNPGLVGLEVTVQFFASPTVAMPCPALGSGFSASNRIRATVGY